MFDLNADWADIERSLKMDPALAVRMKADPGLRIPGCWNGFELMTRAILGRQIGLRHATALAGEVVRVFGQPFSSSGSRLTHLFPTPEALADAELGRIGLRQPQAAAIRAVARAVCSGQLNFDRIEDTKTLLTKLVEVPGIGEGTAQYFAMRALGEPDAFPIEDPILLSALKLSDFHELECRAELWRPWRAYAAIYLWSQSGNSNQGA